MDKIFNNFDKALVFDGSKGVMLQNMGLEGHEAAEEWNVSHKEQVRTVYREYVKAGANVIQTNTFPGNKITLDKHGLGDKIYELNFEGVRLAKDEIGDTAIIAAAVGATGEFLEPAGTLTFDECVESFKEQMRAVSEAGADLVSFETFTDLNEIRAAVLALKEVSKLPFIATMSFEAAGRSLSGNPAECAAIVLEALGAEMVGANCSGGPDTLIEPIKRMQAVSKVPLVVKPNAGLPITVEGKTVYPMEPQGFVPYVEEFLNSGARLIGGCCGTLPAHIEQIAARVKELKAENPKLSEKVFICSAYLYVDIAQMKTDTIIVDGEIDPDDLADEIMDCENDAVILDFGAENIQIDFNELMCTLSLSVRTPLIIKTENESTLKNFLRYYPGKAGAIISGDLKEVAKLYGAAIL